MYQNNSRQDPQILDYGDTVHARGNDRYKRGVKLEMLAVKRDELESERSDYWLWDGLVLKGCDVETGSVKCC